MYEQISQYFKNMTWSVRSLFSTLAVACIGFFILALGITILGTAFRFAFGGGLGSVIGGVSSSPRAMMAMKAPAPSLMEQGMNYGSAGGGAYDASYADESYSGLGIPAIIAPQMMQTVNGSRNSEKYQQEGYAASYETRHLKDTCAKIEALKPLEYVLFDSASQSDNYCSYSFRVEKKRAEEIVSVLKGLGPKDWSVHIQTVAQNIENTEDRVAVLKRRLASVEETLIEVETAYKGVTSAAVQSGRVVDLGSLVTQKLSMIERLSNEKLSIEEQIHQMTGSKDDQIDQTTYASFSVSISKWQAIDWQNISDEWKRNLNATVSDVNRTLSYIVLALPALMVNMIWYGLVIFIVLISLVFFVKHTWALVKRIWN
ncbi:MAG: hypothetical protein WAX38_01225 [Minisyncoccia bacterium]